jgi:hypothetical protein
MKSHLPLLAFSGHGATFELSPLCAAERTSGLAERRSISPTAIPQYAASWATCRAARDEQCTKRAADQNQ